MQTEKGRDFVPDLVALTNWGDRWAAPDGPPIVYEHEGCEGEIRLELRCSACSEPVTPEAVKARPGPGFREKMGLANRVGGLLVDSISINATGFET